VGDDATVEGALYALDVSLYLEMNKNLKKKRDYDWCCVVLCCWGVLYDVSKAVITYGLI
jgi:hypothetical protein